MRHRHLFPALLTFTLGVLSLDAVERRSRPADPGERRLAHAGRERSYLVHDFGGAAPAPVVIVLHGGGGHAANAAAMTGFDRVAKREGLIAVYPNGTGARSTERLLTWNAGHCCAASMDAAVDDVGFIGAIVDVLVANGRADASRVFVTGMSNGGMMAHRIGRELSTKIAGIAPVVGAVFGDEPPPRAPVAAFVVVGADDAIVPPAGGPLTVRLLLGRRQAADRDVAPAIAQAEYWARHNGCGSAPARTEAPAHRRTEWAGCRRGAPVVFVSVRDNGHAWPGGEPGRAGAAPPTRAYDASEAMWAFFKTLPRR
jgi:polyhydroxybutyrate depolymerase